MTPSGRPHVLLIARFFPPSGNVGTRRAVRFAEGLAARGFHVTVLTTEDRFAVDREQTSAVPSGRYGVVKTTTLAPTIRLVARRRASDNPANPAPPGAVHPPAPGGAGRLARLAARCVRALLRPDEDLGWVVPAARAAARLHATDPVDVVIATMPPYSSLLTGAWVAARTGALLVADYRDPWAANREIWSAHDGPQRWIEHAMERSLLPRAALVLFTSPSARDFYRARFPRLPDSRVLYNGIDAGTEATQTGARATGATLTWAHAGNMHGGRRSLAPLLRVMARLRDEVDLRLVLIGPEPSAELELAESLGIGDRVDWRGPMPLADTLRELRAAHRLVAVISRDHPYSIPAKVFDYLATARPILLIADPAHAAVDLLAEAPAHHAIDPAREDQLEALIRADAAALAFSRGLPDVERVDDRLRAEPQMDTLAGWLRDSLAGR